jgi:hypothetical protein
MVHANRRCTVKLLLFLLAGAIVNVVLVFGIIVVEDSMYQESRQATARAEGGVYHISRCDSAFSTVLLTSRSGGRAFGRDMADVYSRYMSGDPKEIAPNWFDLEEMTPAFKHAVDVHRNEQVMEAREVFGVGWPFRCMWKLETHEVRFGTQGTLAYQKPDGQPIGWGLTIIRMNRKMPDQIILQGFLFNSLIFAAILWLLLVVNPQLHRRIRRKRGLCAACGYSLRENMSEKCPECGVATRVTGKL